jgi:GT2 family glycosyltransferase
MGVHLDLVQSNHSVQVAVLMAAHNRMALTAQCLYALRAQDAQLKIHVFLVDDGSSDGTRAMALQIMGDNLTIIQGTGEWYWAKSMAIAEKAALARGGCDYLLWLNDDTFLDESALTRMVVASQSTNDSCIVVGSVRHPVSGDTMYGGITLKGPRFLRQSLPTNENDELLVDTFHGNVVLVPLGVQSMIGTIDGNYEHAFADVDYGLRARGLGISLICLFPSMAVGTVNDSRASLYGGSGIVRHLKLVLSRKNMPFRSTVRFAKRHGGPLWPIYVIWMYLRTFMGEDALRSRRVWSRLWQKSD